MKILVPMKRVADPDNANKVKVPIPSPGSMGSKIETAGLEWKPNPFDEYAIEAALRLTENGTNVKQRLGEVVVVTVGPAECDQTLRGALATGADRAIRIDATDDQLDGDLVARALAKVVEMVKPDLVLMGKQAVDGESNQVGQYLSEYLQWPQVTFAASIVNEGGTSLKVGRAADGGIINLRVKLPAVLTVEDRIVSSKAVESAPTPATHKYANGVRFAPLPAIMQAKKKPLEVKKLAELGVEPTMKLKYVGFEPPPARKAGVKVKSVGELVDKLKNEAKVI
ncbi:MAG: electron transfer flavoprotein subunit beta/FixA family protein [Polyangiales bacterium]